MCMPAYKKMNCVEADHEGHKRIREDSDLALKICLGIGADVDKDDHSYSRIHLSGANRHWGMPRNYRQETCNLYKAPFHQLLVACRYA